jgi:hypothetical protein
MTSAADTQQDAQMRRIIDNLSTDLNNLSSETKRKFASVKEVCLQLPISIRSIIFPTLYDISKASEACLLKLRVINNLKGNLYKSKPHPSSQLTHRMPNLFQSLPLAMCESSMDVVKPFILGCETKQAKIIQICLSSVQKVVEAKILNLASAAALINTLWQLTDAGMEELKVLQTIILLVTTTDVVKHHLLAKVAQSVVEHMSAKNTSLTNTKTTTCA